MKMKKEIILWERFHILSIALSCLFSVSLQYSERIELLHFIYFATRGDILQEPKKYTLRKLIWARGGEGHIIHPWNYLSTPRSRTKMHKLLNTYDLSLAPRHYKHFMHV